MKWYALMIVVIAVMAATENGWLRTITIAVAAVLVHGWIRDALHFEPFTVRIRLLYPLLTDRALASPEQLKSIRHAANNQENRPYSPLLDGISFTVLRPGVLSSSDTLVFWPDFKSFSTNVETIVQLKELEQPATGDVALVHTTWSPSWKLSQRLEGLDLRVSAAPGSFETPRAALLPWSVFGISQWRYGTLSPKRHAAQLKKEGWKEGDSTQTLNHPYFYVDWWHI